MKKIMELADQQLMWVQPRALKMNYELRAGDELVGTLRFRSSLGSFATGETAEGCWTFKRVGFLQTKVTIRVCAEDSDLATFEHNTWRGGGALKFSEARKFLATTNLWQTRLEFQNEAGTTLIQFHQGGLVHSSATIAVLPDAARLPKLPLIVTLGWYLIVMMNMDTAAITAATSAV